MQILNIFHVLVAIALVGFVLIQKGQGATAGASFGAGASATVFGARGAGTFLTRTTWVLAALFCAISLTMAVVVSRTVGVPETDLGVVGDAPAESTEEVLTPADDASTNEGDNVSNDLPALEETESTSADDLPEFVEPEGSNGQDGTGKSLQQSGSDGSLPVPPDESSEEG